MGCAFSTVGEGPGAAPGVGGAPAFLLALHWTWLMGEPSFSRAPLCRALRSLPTGGRREAGRGGPVGVPSGQEGLGASSRELLICPVSWSPVFLGLGEFPLSLLTWGCTWPRAGLASPPRGVGDGPGQQM